MGEKNSDGGQFFTPREKWCGRWCARSIPSWVKRFTTLAALSGFWPNLTISRAEWCGTASATDLARLKHDTFFGREKENLVFPIALANLVLHGTDQPNLWHGNTLSGAPTTDALFEHAPATFDVILTNPFWWQEGADAQKNYSF